MQNLKWISTTILVVRRFNKVVMIGDGQVSLGSTIFKTNAKKVRKISENVICGFAGSAADGFTLVERLENQLEKYPDQTLRACVNLAKMWRGDKFLRHLEASIIVCDKENLIELDGTGNVIETNEGMLAIGSGGNYAIAAAKALLQNTDMDAETIAENALKIAADTCIYTNHNFVKEKLEW